MNKLVEMFEQDVKNERIRCSGRRREWGMGEGAIATICKINIFFVSY